MNKNINTSDVTGFGGGVIRWNRVIAIITQRNGLKGLKLVLSTNFRTRNSLASTIFWHCHNFGPMGDVNGYWGGVKGVKLDNSHHFFNELD